MSHLSSFSTFIVERLLSSILSFINRSRCSVSLLNHNGHSIWEYPERNWKLVPFPDQKGNPFNADNLATVNRHSFLDDPDFKRSRAAAQARWEVSIAPRDISWRLHVILWAFGLAHKNHVAHNSIYVELGTGRGYMAAAICEYYSLQDFLRPFI